MKKSVWPSELERHFWHATSLLDWEADNSAWHETKCFNLTDDPRTVIAEFVDFSERLAIGKSMREGFCSAVCEIVHNAMIHSESSFGACIFGEYRGIERIFEIAVYDAGVGFRDKVAKRTKCDMTAAESIEWAMVEGHTVIEAGRPGPSGLGLKETADFMLRNRGAMAIATGNACWRLAGGRGISRELQGEIVGTLVQLSFNMANNYSYLKRIDAVPLAERQHENYNPHT